ncbi:glycosyltransferase [Maribacter confluentis]|uniref:Glycosyltransferase n=1 Tax=Maribacter confluentis TaxID=1656093 RepID=A0ABT8RS45_9FLAO|nr:glycosyltransferase [Maribacter confluentis]MDO1513696.1 glycosyltransferase [Maribacter confluentis]
MKKKILIFHPALVPYRVDFFNSLHVSFYSHFFFIYQNAITQNFNQDDLRSSCKFACQYLDTGFEILGKTFRKGVVSKIKEVKPDIVICSEYGPITILLLLYARFMNKSFKLYTISDDSVDGAANRRGLRALVRNLVSKNIDGVIFNSDEVFNWHNKNISNKIKPLILPIIHKDELLRTRMIDSISIANININKHKLLGKKIILFVGRLEKVKNVDFLIKSYLDINYKNTVLVIVGEGSQQLVLKKMAQRKIITGDIIFTGRLEGKELYSWYLLANIFVLPSIYEPYGAVVNEALLAGCIVLCSKKAGASSLITRSNGSLFNPTEEEELMIKMNENLENCQPLNEEIKALRDSKMPFTFDDKINKLTNNFLNDI